MDPVDRLLAIEEIKQLKGRYFRGVDFKDRNLILNVFAEDCVVDFRDATRDLRTGLDASPVPLENLIHGNKAIADLIALAGERMDSVHHASIPEIEILSETTAKGLWPMVDRLIFKMDGPVSELVGYGHYHETYEKVKGAWKVKTMKLTRTRVDNTPA